MDTRTGTYFVNIRTESGFESINFTTGKVNIYDVQVTDKRQNREPAPLVEAPVAPNVAALAPTVAMVAEILAKIPPSAVASSGLVGKSQYTKSVVTGAKNVEEVETSRK